MNKPLKAALLSAIIYPGAGHFFLKNYKTSFVFIGIFSITLFLVVSEVLYKTNQVVEQIKSGEIPLDITAITTAVSNITSSSEVQGLNVTIYVMIVVWFIAILDSYRTAKKHS